MTTELSPALLSRGYDALDHVRSRRSGGDAYWARLLGRRTLVVRGEAGARLLYDESVISREGAVPRPLSGLLFGRGAVHGLDGDQHRARKAVFLDVLTDDSVRALANRVDRGLEEAVATWAGRPRVALHQELVRVYGAAVLAWSGIPGTDADHARLSDDLAAIVAGFGFRPGAYPGAWAARVRSDRWARTLVRRARSGEVATVPGTALEAFSTGAGADLPVPVAAVDLLNVLRPTVAVSWLGTFAALALAEHPDEAAGLLGEHADARLRDFADEVRRCAPFVPALTGLVTRDVEALGEQLRAGDRVLLDVRGTNLHPEQWLAATDFRPARFLDQDPGPYRFVPQGGGSVLGHRCPGEGVTTSLLLVTLDHLARTSFTVTAPEVRTDRMPTLPRGGLVLTEVVPHRPTRLAS